jgi:hypothetical protein
MAILVKCNASDVPSGSTFSGTFLAEKEAQPADGDEVFIWTSERSRQRPYGKGLELRGRLVSWRRFGSNATVRVRISDRLPEAGLSMNGLAALGREFMPARNLHQRIRKFRHRRIWALPEEQTKILDDVFKRGEQGEAIEILADIDQVQKDATINQATRKALIAARLGQGSFRRKLEQRWGSGCAVTGCLISAVLRASHVKPWRVSSNIERLDPANGILLAAHLDALFDSGLISFGDEGKMLVSTQISAQEKQFFRLPAALRTMLSTAEKRFLSHHRGSIFKKG